MHKKKPTPNGEEVDVSEIQATLQQLTNQLAEVVSRTGRIERQLAAAFPDVSIAAAQPPGVAQGDAETIGARFWTIVETGGQKTAVPVERIKGLEDDEEGTIAYKMRRTDGADGRGPTISRTLGQLFRSKEEAEAPRTASSTKHRRVVRVQPR